jgi:hypothetical protein
LPPPTSQTVFHSAPQRPSCTRIRPAGSRLRSPFTAVRAVVLAHLRRLRRVHEPGGELLQQASV